MTLVRPGPWRPLLACSAIALIQALAASAQPAARATEIALAIDEIQMKARSDRLEALETGFVDWFVNGLDEVKPPVRFLVVGQTADYASVVDRRAQEETLGLTAPDIRATTADYLVKPSYQYSALDDTGTVTVWLRMVDMKSGVVVTSVNDRFSIHNSNPLVRVVSELIRQFCAKKGLGATAYAHRVVVALFEVNEFKPGTVDAHVPRSIARSLESRLNRLAKVKVHRPREPISTNDVDPATVAADLFLIGFMEVDRKADGTVWTHINIQIINRRRTVVIDLELEETFDRQRMSILISNKILEELESPWNDYAETQTQPS